MRIGVIKASAALFALALLVGVFGLNTQPTQAILSMNLDSTWASVPAARPGFGVNAASSEPAVADTQLRAVGPVHEGAAAVDGATVLRLLTLHGKNFKGDWL